MHSRIGVLIFICLMGASTSCLSQALMERLSNSIKCECKINASGVEFNCGNIDSRIDEKMNQSAIFLQAQLSDMIIVDSSDFYEKMHRELKELEQKQIGSARDSVFWLHKLERTLLIVSVLKPMKADKELNKLVKIWCGVQQDAILIRSRETLCDWRAWLYGLLDDRFHKEDSTFGKRKNLSIYTKALYLLDNPFKSIDSQRQIMYVVVALMKESKNDSLIYKAYLQKAAELEIDYYTRSRLDTMREFLLELYHEAHKLAPDLYATNYNLFRFYYNEGVVLLDTSSENDFDLNANQAQAKIYFEKAAKYSRKISGNDVPVGKE